MVRRKAPNALIISARGMGNIGDDLVAEMTKFALESVSPRSLIRFGQVPFRRDEVEWADIVMLGGGGLIYDSDPSNVDNYMDILEHANYMGKTTIVSAVGVQGNIVSEYGCRRYKDILNRVDLLTVRHSKDVERLQAIGVDRPIHQVADAGFLLPQSLSKRRGNPKEVALAEQIARFKDGSNIVAISIANEEWSDEKLQGLPQEQQDRRRSLNESISTLISKLSSSNKVALVLHSKDDYTFYMKNSNDNTILIDLTNQSFSTSALMDIYNQFDAVVASRYHSYVLSVLTRKPFLGFDGKIGKTIRDYTPSLSDSYCRLDDLKDPDTLSRYCDPLKYGVIVSQDDVNAAIVAANKNTEYLKSILYRINK